MDLVDPVFSLSGRARPGRVVAAVLAATFLLVFAGPRPPALAQEGLAITAPYPSVSAQPGSTATFDLEVRADEPVRVDLTIEDVPDGWSTTLRGGGREVGSVSAHPETPPELTLDVAVPDDATAGTTTITVVGTAGGESVRLPLDVVVVSGDGGTVTMSTDVPARQAAADEAFEFNLTLENDTPQQLTFDLTAAAPRGWTVSVHPTGEEDASSVAVDARASQDLVVEATPPSQATEGDYLIAVEARAGEQTAAIELLAQVTGRVAFDFTTADQRLNTTANAGTGRDVPVVVVNTGTAPLRDVSLSGQGPTDWEVTFEPAVLDEVAPGATGEALARITPSENAVAGDYVVMLESSADGATESFEVRVTVETPPIWGVVGIGLIVLTLGGLAWVFRRYGRR